MSVVAPMGSLQDAKPAQASTKSPGVNKKGGNLYNRTIRYGISPEEYEELLDEQLNCCACCGSSDPKRKAGFVIDHDHETGIIRGLLCHSCNIGIGLLGDSLSGLQTAVNYLRKHYDNT